MIRITRRQRLAAMALLAIAAATFTLGCARTPEHAAKRSGQEPVALGVTRSDAPVRKVLGVAITVSDLESMTDWYMRTLDCALLSTSDLSGESFSRLVGIPDAHARVATLRLGDERLQLVEFLSPKGRPFPPDSRPNDRWFQHIAIIVRDMDEAISRLGAAGAQPASLGPQRLPDWNPSAGGIEAYYFRDPDGHFLEVLRFPDSKGDDRWHSTDRLFLGIDHTAIVVDDTERSLAHYRDILGLRVAGESENYGVEQERLNAVFPARLRITSLRASSGPAIEFLEYLTPRDGRPTPIDTRPNDLWHWHILLDADRPDDLFTAVRAAGGWPVSPGAQRVRWPAEHGGDSALLARDPDGHAALFLSSTELEP